MPEANQYTVTNKELLELLIKKCDVHEGKWILLANFGIAPGNYGPMPAEVSPGVVVAVQNLGIQKADPTTPVEMVIDASVANPKAG